MLDGGGGGGGARGPSGEIMNDVGWRWRRSHERRWNADELVVGTWVWRGAHARCLMKAVAGLDVGLVGELSTILGGQSARVVGHRRGPRLACRSVQCLSRVGKLRPMLHEGGVGEA